MFMFKIIRRLACVTALGIAVLGWASPAHADILLTISDGTLTETYGDYTGNVGMTLGGLTYGATTQPGVISLSGTFDSAFVVSNLGIVANYNALANGGSNSSGSGAIPPPGSSTALVTDDTITATKVGGGSGTLTVTVAAGNWTIPGGTPLLLGSGETSSFISGTGDSAAFTSTFTSLTAGGNPLLAQSAASVSISGPVSPPVTGAAGSSAVVSNPNSLFALSNQLQLTFGTGGNSINVDGTTAVTAIAPEPSTIVIAGIGALGMIGYGLRRRKALGA